MQLHFGTAGRIVSVACVVSLAACGGGGGNDGSAQMVRRATTRLTDTALVSNGVIAAAHTDSNLLNAWGLAS